VSSVDAGSYGFAKPSSTHSPILAALTTQSQIFVYTADTNQLKGPWRQLECLNGGSERHIISMAWVEGDATHAWLLAGTRQGDFIAWRIAAGSVEEHSITQMTEGGIIGIASSPAGFLFLTTTKGVHMAQATQSSNDITFRPAHHQPPAMSGCHISMARWHGTAVLYCTPGQIHYFDVKSGVGQSVLLEKSDDDESCSMRPAICESDETLRSIQYLLTLDLQPLHTSTRVSGKYICRMVRCIWSLKAV
jgi:hypothetical protein